MTLVDCDVTHSVPKALVPVKRVISQCNLLQDMHIAHTKYQNTTVELNVDILVLLIFITSI